MQVPGKKIKNYRDSKGLIKDDVIDAKAVYDFFMENGGKTVTEKLRNSTKIMRLPSQNDKGGGARVLMPKSASQNLPSSIENKGGDATTILPKRISTFMPAPFYLFIESDASIAEIKILFREHEDLKKEMVREKLKRIAFEMKFKIAKVADDRIKKMLFHKDASIVAKEKEVEQLKKILEKKVKNFDIWNKYLKNVKAIGPIIASGLIGELGANNSIQMRA